ncbi:MAG: hypothetical protein LBH01_01045 [Verrucomicrobiales bacterium]|jgi:hypothetical protein|nr:hypothetical protein [Verrucomicrobiales bacterium]
MNELEETLSGPLAKKYGPLPKVALPGNDELLLDFAKQLLEKLKDKGLYRRDKIPVVPFRQGRRLEAMDAVAFRSWVERHVVCYRTRYDREGNPVDELRSMPRELAAAVLESWDFWPGLPEIERCHPVPMPVLRADGTLELLEPGYDAESKTLTFDGL